MSDEHARLSFSASERWLRCAASVRMSDGVPNPGNSASEEGTFAHKVMEQTLNKWWMLGDSTVGEFSFPADKDTSEWESCNIMAQHVQKCVDFVISEFESFPGVDKRIYFEEKVDCHYMTGRDDTWGTADVRIESTEALAVFDLKYGAGIFVEADTSQNRLYLLGGMCPTLKETRGVAPWETVTGWIMQPRYADQEGEIFRGTEYEPDELMEWMDTTVKPAMGLTDNPPAPVAGATQCRFCVAQPTCPAAAKMAQDICSVFEPVETNQLLPVIGTVLPDVGDLTDEDVERLIYVHDNAPFVTAYLKSAGERLRKLIESRDPRVHGKLKCVVSRRNTVYKDGVEPAAFIEAMAAGKGKTVKDGYIPKKKFVSEQPLTASQMLKLKLNKEQTARLEEFIEKSEGSLTIVPWADERPNAFPPIEFEDHTVKYDFL